MFHDFTPLSLVDYPGHVAATAFIGGCNFRCPYCHNAGLIPAPRAPRRREEEFLAYLRRRRSVLEGVCVTGGEPTLWDGLEGFLGRLRALGLRIKLDTQGSRPDVLGRLLRKGLVDYVAMDVKAPRDAYGPYTREARVAERVERSVRLVKEHAPDYEFRTTVVEHMHRPEDVLAIAHWIAPARRYVLQAYRPSRSVLDPATCGGRPTAAAYLEQLRRRLPKDAFGEVLVRP
jgi:pyruvate formate lyase activating enzyme